MRGPVEERLWARGAAGWLAVGAMATWLVGCAGEAPGGEPPLGSAARPIVIESLPFDAEGNTALAREEALGPRSCSEESEGSGPEVHYELVVERPGRLGASVVDGVGVDVDLLLFEGEGVPRCLAWADQELEGWLSAGVYRLVVDTYAGSWLAGPYHLEVDLAGEL